MNLWYSAWITYPLPVSVPDVMSEMSSISGSGSNRTAAISAMVDLILSSHVAYRSSQLAK